MTGLHQRSRAPSSAMALALGAVLLAGGCASVSERVSNLWPFGRSAGEVAARPQDGRIPVLGSAEGLTVDQELAAVPVTLPAPRTMADWPNAGGNAANAPEHLAGDGTPGLDVVWRRGLVDGAGARKALIAPPVVAGGRVYAFGTGLDITAADAKTGRVAWRTTLNTPGRRMGWFRGDVTPLAGGLALGGGRLFAAHGFGEVVSLDAATGSIGWRTRTQTPLHASPTVADGKVFVTSYDSEIYAFDANSGAISWTSAAIPEPARMLTSPSPAVSGETVIAPFPSGEVVALLSGNGRRLWLDGLTRASTGTSLASINDIAGRPVVKDGIVYAVSQSGVLAAIDLRSGTRIWELPVASIQTPWVAGDWLFVVTTDAELVCINRLTGGVRWMQQLDRFENTRKREGRIVWTGPVLIDGELVLANSAGFAAVVNPADGIVKSRLRLNAPVFVAPAVADGMIYFLTDKGEVVAAR